MELNEAQKLFKRLRATGLCPYVAEQAVRCREAHLARRYPASGPDTPPLNDTASLMGMFVWHESKQGMDFWAEQAVVQCDV